MYLCPVQQADIEVPAAFVSVNLMTILRSECSASSGLQLKTFSIYNIVPFDSKAGVFQVCLIFRIMSDVLRIENIDVPS